MCCSGGIHWMFRWPRTFRVALHHEPSNGNDDLSKEVCLALQASRQEDLPYSSGLRVPLKLEKRAVEGRPA
jgi:hypothetical protein